MASTSPPKHANCWTSRLKSARILALDEVNFTEVGTAAKQKRFLDLRLAGNARIVANAADPFDTPEQIDIRERINCVNSLAHWQIITESESIKEPRGRSRSQSYSQIALLHSHLFLHDQLTFADISGTDSCRSRECRHVPSSSPTGHP